MFEQSQLPSFVTAVEQLTGYRLTYVDKELRKAEATGNELARITLKAPMQEGINRNMWMTGSDTDRARATHEELMAMVYDTNGDKLPVEKLQKVESWGKIFSVSINPEPVTDPDTGKQQVGPRNGQPIWRTSARMLVFNDENIFDAAWRGYGVTLAGHDRNGMVLTPQQLAVRNHQYYMDMGYIPKGTPPPVFEAEPVKTVTAPVEKGINLQIPHESDEAQHPSHKPPVVEQEPSTPATVA